jgi:hypothetical protein
LLVTIYTAVAEVKAKLLAEERNKF